MKKGNSGYTLKQLRGAWGAGRQSAIDEASIVGKYCHVLEDEYIESQIKVLSEISDGKFLVQFFSWIDGEPTTQKIMPLSDMESWVFYPSKDEWLDAAHNANLG